MTCALSYYEELVHILCECTSTEPLRQNLDCAIKLAYGASFLNELSSQDELAWTLRILGANIPPVLDCDSEKQFLRMCYSFILRCLTVH